MGDEHFNGLAPDQAERLALLVEELAEAGQVVGKILRHGYASRHPKGGPNNRELLEIELADVLYAVNLMCETPDLNIVNIEWNVGEKAKRVRRYLHHQDSALLNRLAENK